MGQRGLYADASLTGGPEMLGMSGQIGSQAAGQALPPTTAHPHTGSDSPWSPDSAMFWLILFTVGAVAGIAGASAQVRVFKGRAGASVGST